MSNSTKNTARRRKATAPTPRPRITAGESPADAKNERKAQGNSAAKPKGEDVALVWGKTKDGGMNILRKRDDQIEAGSVVPLREGQPIHGEVVQLHPRTGSPLCDVEVHVPAPRSKDKPANASSGPPQVATDSYRRNWGQIYGRAAGQKLLN